MNEFKEPYLEYINLNFPQVDILQLPKGTFFRIESEDGQNPPTKLKWYEKAHKIEGINSFNVEMDNEHIVLPYLGPSLCWILGNEGETLGSTNDHEFLKKIIGLGALQFAYLKKNSRRFRHSDAKTTNVTTDGENVYVIDPFYPKTDNFLPNDTMNFLWDSRRDLSDLKMSLDETEAIIDGAISAVNSYFASIHYNYELRRGEKYAIRKIKKKS
tara:strand:- start:1079 stop:1720 length:642 start_codon:yes stop_codon:yes gene_type:complete